jgi:hypothetical protein
MAGIETLAEIMGEADSSSVTKSLAEPCVDIF